MPEQNSVDPDESPGFRRRAVLGGAAATGLGAALGIGGAATASAATTPTPTPVTGASPSVVRQRVRAVVVGSGFGGGVTALRLAQAGVSTLVLERGRWWPTGPNSTTFCRVGNIDGRSSWLTDHSVLPGVGDGKTWTPYTGVIESVAGNGMTLNCGAAVGGGSLMYHGMTLQPSPQAFAESIPLMAGDYTSLDRTYYPRVARMLQIATIPDSILNADQYKSSRLFLDVAPQAGLSTFRVPLPVNWYFAQGELNGWYTPTYTTSDIDFGVDNGGKHSIDVTYLAAAQATGKVTVAALHWVRDISMNAQGKWVIDVDQIDTGGNVLVKKQITADAVFLNAGTGGTTRLLVKAKAKGLIPNLPDAVGTQWGNNGDRIWAWLNPNGDPGTVQGGPACVGGYDLSNASSPITIIHAGSPLAPPPGTTLVTLVGMGIVQGLGTWTYDATTDDAVLTWPPDADAALQAQIAARMNQFAAVGGGFLMDTNAQAPSTWHGLGGVPMGDAVDKYGRVLGHKGLYVLDGARIPGSTGAVNPSFTIAALAEHSMATITQQDVGNVF